MARVRNMLLPCYAFVGTLVDSFDALIFSSDDESFFLDLIPPGFRHLLVWMSFFVVDSF